VLTTEKARTTAKITAKTLLERTSFMNVPRFKDQTVEPNVKG
jgi:hypothetical protein